jgi:glucose-1-phosphate adenylyltransferase
MVFPRVVAFVMAGGEGRRLRPLTERCPKPALAFGSGLRIVDFVLSNLYNSGIRSIYVLAQYCPEPLLTHIAHAWSPRGADAGTFVKALLPSSNRRATYLGTADAVRQNMHLIDHSQVDLVAVFAADQIYRMDVRQMIAFHREHKADATVAAVSIPIASAARFGIISADRHARVLRFDEKPRVAAPMPGNPDHAYASMGNYLFHPKILRQALSEAARHDEHDFGRHVLPRLASTHRVYAYDFSNNCIPGLQPHQGRGYWRDVGTLDAYAAARRDASGSEPRFVLHHASWPVRPLYPAGSDANDEHESLATPTPRRAAGRTSHEARIY